MSAYPALCIDTTDRCPECKRELSDREIRGGWTDRPTDYTTTCPKCGDRFAAQFVVSLNPKFKGLPSLSAPSASSSSNSAPSPSSALPTGESAAAPASALSPHREGRSEDELYLYQQHLQSLQYAALTAAAHSGSERFPLTLPYLPPRVLRRELARVLDEHGVGYITHPSFRLHSTTLYWNLSWHLCCLCLPVHMLLWDMSEPKVIAQEKMEMGHVMRSLSPEQRERRRTERLSAAATAARATQRSTRQRAREARLIDAVGVGAMESSRNQPSGGASSPSPGSPHSGAASPTRGGQSSVNRLSTVAENVAGGMYT